ncbi:mandelate racemase/muconate lactonizing enzyme family protein [Dyadobacter subterraneus]|uniref:Mandelate racemase/muconate lactonizing enzyme family protein n=1 Tax=Dyadobacter subterraneus TaxID=2773304 RepID=A0ABR9WBC7_9BACT|nr:mandelate racemase/muconate lactonizing enzyme family protein [Dyadobacter subterraneus]MBE9462794.1 mandelate racemase/muconate lactonizing enzyme family protein [Dyadobacter subterraneus]
MERRNFLRTTGLIPLALIPEFSGAEIKLTITDIQVHVVKVNTRGNWYFIELKTNKGISGLGEASHGFTLKDGDAKLLEEIKILFELVRGESPFQVEQFRQRGLQKSNAKGKTAVTAFSAIEHALWDLNGKALGIPVYDLLGGKLRDKLKVYANINRATNERDANGRRLIPAFQKNAEDALKSGFKAVKLAPFDDMKPLATSNPKQIEDDIDYAVSCIEAVRKTIGKDVDLLIDVHSHLNKELAISTAKRLESSDLYWYEEAIDPEKYTDETKAITEAIKQGSAGGESIIGREGYNKIISQRALDIIMPDVKHCGGIQELRFIAAHAETAGDIKVSPHNPSGPVSTAASVQVCAAIPNFSILEYAYGEVPWRADLLSPSEHFEDGYIGVPDTPGLGHKLNYELLKKHAV